LTALLNNTLKKKVKFVHYLKVFYKLDKLFCMNNAWYDDYD